MSSDTQQRIDRFGPADTSRIIEMAWEDRTPFEAIETLYGLNEKQVVAFMRDQLKARSFRRWRKRVSGRKTKHRQLRPAGVLRAYCPTQYKP
ncbi:TIGR03643 family protein [Halomonas cibimaris]|uniref:TIGR03643 family protein n=1 Tax=Halomonas cibimaris TaxID=657012 RepID=A0ABP7LHK0_9GAMM